MKITDLTPEQVALIAAGGATAASLGVTEDLNPPATAVVTPAPAAAAAPAPAAAVTEPTAAQAAAPAPAPAPDMVAFYASQVTTLNAQLVSAQVELQTLQVSTQSMKTNFDGLLKIAREATGKLNIALGGTAAAAEGMDAATIIAEHARVSATFTEKFKPGRQSAPAQAVQEPTKADIPPAFFSAVKRAPSAA